MRPLKLEIEGFTVYKKPQVIDFERLNFFVIQGRTGAGKTSIVDAITYALYGKVPRYGSVKAGKLVLSKGSSKLWVALDFSVGGKRYRVERFYRQKPEESTVRVYEEGRRLNLSVSQVESWVEKVTGLDYRTFTKVILLPQGEFDRFLKPSSPKERREILINLLNLEVFEKIRQLASESYREIEGELSALRTEYESLRDLSEEDIRELEGERKKVESEIGTLKEKVLETEDLLRKAREGETLRRELRDAVERLRELEEKEEDTKMLKEKAEMARRVLPYLPYIERLESIDRELRDLRLQRERQIKEKVKVEEELRNVEEEKEEVEREFRNLPQLRKELQDILRDTDRLREVEDDLRSLEEIRKEVEREKRELSEKEKILRECEERLKKGEAYIEEVKRELERVSFDEEEYDRVLREVERKRNLLEKKERLEEIEKEISELESGIRRLEEEVENVKRELEKGERRLKEASLKVYAHRIRSHLKEGDRCPVCGGKFRGGEVRGEEEDISHLESEIKKLQERYISLEKELSSLRAKRDSLKKEEEGLRSKLKGWEEILRIDIEGKLKELEERRRERRKLEERYRKYQERFNQLIRDRERALREVERKRNEIDSLRRSEEERKGRLLSIFQKIPTQMEIRKRIEEMERIARDMEDRIREIEERRERVKGYWEELSKRLIAYDTRLKELLTAIDKKEKERKENLRKLTPIFEELSDIERIKEISLPEERIKGIEEEVESFYREYELLKEKISSLNEKLKEYEGLPSSQTVERELTEMSIRLEGLLRRLGEIEKSIEQKREMLEKKKGMEKRIREIERELQVYSRIKEDLKSDRLQDFVSSLMLNRVVERASEYLFNFSNYYELIVDAKGDLSVVDRVQGVERDIKSLSGGETFLASLSLALGVSDVLSANAHLESLFIDEGFGSLDEETRERVNDILELLRQRINRMVGIISHIPDMAERFHQRIVVKRHGDFSTVEIVY